MRRPSGTVLRERLRRTFFIYATDIRRSKLRSRVHGAGLHLKQTPGEFETKPPGRLVVEGTVPRLAAVI